MGLPTSRGLARPRSFVGEKCIQIVLTTNPESRLEAAPATESGSCSGRPWNRRYTKKGESKERWGKAMLTAHPEYGYSLSEIPRCLALHCAAISKVKKEGVR